ncbi:hypothetical protein GPECTOR_11g76 [Gonium pectorale]|uniref:Uncharacterized protein n=1 Tax=Gonium pectorale TaxID=33097 RepID=A0A150GQD1_GONPE|nr:hypothetical protein GPECTOR_11g76 [Gonium pectorale]|eukprot:KXZ51952.1 hypothetical protein GPECTOR_11g76 [Gonium pectorale]
MAEEGPISCGAYATHDESGVQYPSKFRYLQKPVGVTAWWRKWFTVAVSYAPTKHPVPPCRAARRSSQNQDVLVIDDWYWRVKQPPLSGYNMLSQNEWGINFNGGFSYIQNASQTGPVAWILYDHLHRVGERQQLRIDDQGMIQECVFSAAAGRPIYPAMLPIFGDDQEAYKKMGTTESGLFQALHDPVRQAWREGERHTITGELLAHVCEHYQEAVCDTEVNGTVIISTVTVNMPHSGGKYPLELGGFPFNKTVGPFTKAYRDAYKDLGVPLPPDPEDPATEAAAKATPSETFGYLAHRRSDEDCVGCWAEGTWWMTGRFGWWHKNLRGDLPGKVGMGHIWANLFPGDYQKEMILMLTGHYNWRVAARVAKSRQRAYIANQGTAPWVSLPEVRTVVAFKPGVIHAAMSKAEFVQAAQGLAQVAVALGAIAAWPAVPCDSDWALTEEARKSMPRPIQHRVPWSYLNTFFQVQPFGDSLKDLQCEWPGFGFTGCLTTFQPGHNEIGRGMLAVEFHHLLNTSRAVPTQHTTLSLGATAGPPPAAGNTARQPVAYKDIVTANAESILQRLQREHMPIFWLDRLVEVQGMEGEAGQTYKRWYDRCRALQYLDLPQNERERW